MASGDMSRHFFSRSICFHAKQINLCRNAYHRNTGVSEKGSAGGSLSGRQAIEIIKLGSTWQEVECSSLIRHTFIILIIPKTAESWQGERFCFNMAGVNVVRQWPCFEKLWMPKRCFSWTRQPRHSHFRWIQRRHYIEEVLESFFRTKLAWIGSKGHFGSGNSVVDVNVPISTALGLISCIKKVQKWYQENPTGVCNKSSWSGSLLDLRGLKAAQHRGNAALWSWVILWHRIIICAAQNSVENYQALHV